MKNLTLSADSDLIEAARERARAGHGTLNDRCRIRLRDDARRDERMADDDRLMQELRGKVRIGRKLSRDELNER